MNTMWPVASNSCYLVVPPQWTASSKWARINLFFIKLFFIRLFHYINRKSYQYRKVLEINSQYASATIDLNLLVSSLIHLAQYVIIYPLKNSLSLTINYNDTGVPSGRSIFENSKSRPQVREDARVGMQLAWSTGVRSHAEYPCFYPLPAPDPSAPTCCS